MSLSELSFPLCPVTEMKQAGLGRIYRHFLFPACFGVFQLCFCLSLSCFRWRNTWYVSVTHVHIRYSFKATSFTSRAVMAFRSEKIGTEGRKKSKHFLRLLGLPTHPGFL